MLQNLKWRNKTFIATDNITSHMEFQLIDDTIRINEWTQHYCGTKNKYRTPRINATFSINCLEIK